MVSATKNNNALSGIRRLDLFFDQIHGRQIGDENNHSFLKVLVPQCTKTPKQFVYFGFTGLGKYSEETDNPQSFFGQRQVN